MTTSSWLSCKLPSSKPDFLLMPTKMTLGLYAANQQLMLPGTRAVLCRYSAAPMLQMQSWLLKHLMCTLASPVLTPA